MEKHGALFEGTADMVDIWTSQFKAAESSSFSSTDDTRDLRTTFYTEVNIYQCSVESFVYLHAEHTFHCVYTKNVELNQHLVLQKP